MESHFILVELRAICNLNYSLLLFPAVFLVDTNTEYSAFEDHKGKEGREEESECVLLSEIEILVLSSFCSLFLS